MEANTLEKGRLNRLRRTQCILGEPDLITQYRITTFNSFLTQKKNVEFGENFVAGLNFPTTAHFSSYVNKRIREWGRDPKNQTQFRMKLNMYDAFKKLDVQIEVSIPGSMEMRGFGLNGQPVKVTEQDYQGAYYSSILRSLWCSYTHSNLLLFTDLQDRAFLISFIKDFISFALQNPLSIQEASLQDHNIGLEILLLYIKGNKFHNLATHAIEVLKLEMPERAYLFQLELKQSKEDYKGIIIETASKLLEEQSNPLLVFELKKYQVRSLASLHRQNQVKMMTEVLMREGLDDIRTWQAILISYLESSDEKVFMKLLNTAINFVGEENLSIEHRLIKLVSLESMRDGSERKRPKDTRISKYPEYCFKFDQEYMEKQTRLKLYRDILQKSDKQKMTLQLLHRLEISDKKQKSFQQLTSDYEKQKGWNKLLLLRAECFWLENDYHDYQSTIKKKNNEISYRFMNQKFPQTENLPNVSKINLESEESEGKAENVMNESFDGDFSDADSEAEEKAKNIQIPARSKRVATKRVNNKEFVQKKGQTAKILCHYSLQTIFLNLYHDIKLHGDLEKWFSKLNFQSLEQLSQQKRQLLAFLSIKKAYFHKRMLRYRKCEEALKVARKFSSSLAVGLISCYSLAKLYLEHKNVKGVEFYTIEIVKILWTVGIQTYDLLPEWARQFIPFIIKIHGKGIVNRLQGPLNDLVSLWLKIDEPKPIVVQQS